MEKSLITNNCLQSVTCLKIIRFIVTLSLYFAVIFPVWMSFITIDGGINEDKRLSMPVLLSHEADRPFIYRILTPTLINFLDHSIDDKLFNFYEKYYWKIPLLHELHLANLDEKYTHQWIIFTWLFFLIFISFGFIMKNHIEKFYHTDSVSSFAWSLVSIALLPVFFGPNSYIYDPFSILLPSLLWYVLIRNRVIPYYFIYVLICLNKETGILMFILFFSYYYKIYSKLFLLFHAFLHVLIYSLIYLSVRYIFMNNQGSSLELHFWQNLNFLITPSFHLLFFLIKFSVFLFLFLYQKKDQQRLLRRTLSLILIPMVPLWIFFGRIPEIRIFDEFYFLIFLVLLPSLWTLLQQKNPEVAKEDK